MKRSKRLVVLLGVLAVACIAMCIALRVEQYQEDIANSGETVFELNADTVEALSWEYDGVSFAFERTDDGWLYEADEDFPVSSDAIDGLLAPFASLNASFVIEDVEDYGQYGLDDPLCTITLQTADESDEVTVGDFSAMDEERYLSLGDGKVYLVSDDPIEYYDATLPELIQNDQTPDADTADEITFTGTADYTITYTEDSADTYRADDVYFAQIDGASLPLDTGRVESYLGSLQYLDLTDYVTYKVTDDQLADYGLDDPELTVSLAYTAEDENGDASAQNFVLAVSRDPAQRDEDETEDEEIAAYARVADSQIAYRLTTADYQALMAAEYDDLRHAEVIPAELSDIGRIDVTLEDSTYTLTCETSGDEMTYTYQDEDVEEGDADDLQTALEGLLADSFTDEQPDDKQEIALTCYLDLDGDPTVEVVLYRYDGNSCLAVVDGEPTAFVARDAVVELVEAVNVIVLN